MTHNHTLGTSFMTSAVTAFVALWPGEAALSYVEKLASVIVLAAAAEAGRRFIGFLLDKKK